LPKLISKLLIPVLAGLVAATLAFLLSQLGLKYVLAFCVMVGGVVVLLLQRSSERIQSLMIIGLALAIPLNLDVNFFFQYHIGGASSIGITASNLFVMGLYLTYIYQYRTRQMTPLIQAEPALIWPSLAFMTVGIFSLWNARYQVFVFLEEIRLIGFFLTMVAVMNLRTEKQIHSFVLFLSIAAFMQGSLASIQYLGNTSLGLGIFGETEALTLNIGYSFSRATGTTGHPNTLGYFLEIALPLMLAMFLVERRFWFRLWYLACFLIPLSGLVGTLSRGAWLTVPISCTLVFWVLYRRKIFRLGTGVGVSLVGAVLLVVLFFTYPIIMKRFLHDDYQSAATRMPLNYATLSIIRQYPVLGVGLNNFSEVFMNYDTTGYSRKFTQRVQQGNTIIERPYKHVVHNLILWVWAEIGTVGLAVFLWMFIAAYRVARRAFRRSDEWSKGVLTGCIVGFIAHMAHGMVDPGFRITITVSTLIYAMFGLIGAISLMTASRERIATRPGTAKFTPLARKS